MNIKPTFDTIEPEAIHSALAQKELDILCTYTAFTR